MTVTPSPATSRASVRRNPVRPARAVLERISVGMGWRTAMDVIATTLPHLRARISGTAVMLASEARHHRLFVDLARTTGVLGAAELDGRIEEIAAHEASVIADAPHEARLHN